MASDIQPGAYVRAIGGMYAGATGRVVAVGQSASGPYATVDVGETQPIAIFVTGLELVGETTSMAEQERDRLRAAEAAVADAIEQLGGYPDSQLEGEGGLAAAVAADRARLERGIIAERDQLKARHAELMRLADRAFRRRKNSHEGSSLIAMARELEPTIAALTVLADDGRGLGVSDG